ncbi:MAG: ATP-binding protein [Muribaculaceae bacterium]|nr:ATP-binding protein [Muribaculaceae bacterium]
MEYISRHIESTVLEMAKYFPVIVITGPRQSGKTTLIKHLFGEYLQFSMEDLHIREFAEQDPVAFLEQNKQGMIIDEVQRVPTLMSYIQGIVDKDPSRHFILSGSSNFAMLQSVTQSLAGRAAILELLPMSIPEISDFAKSLTLDELIFGGMYPAVCAQKIPPEFAYPSYVKTYLERDVRNLLRISNLSAYEKFLKLCAGRIGSLFVASQLANEVGVSVNTIKSWLSVLQSSYVITLLPPYFENVSKRLIKTPKIYFIDTGVACYLLDIESPQQLARDKMRGPLFENLIVMEAIKYRTNQGKAPNAYFYRDSNQNEIDLLLKNGEDIKGIEIKSSMTYHKDFEHTLRNMSKYINGNTQQRAVVYAGDMENRLGEIQLINYLHLKEFLT